MVKISMTDCRILYNYTAVSNVVVYLKELDVLGHHLEHSVADMAIKNGYRNAVVIQNAEGVNIHLNGQRMCDQMFIFASNISNISINGLPSEEAVEKK